MGGTAPARARANRPTRAPAPPRTSTGVSTSATIGDETPARAKPLGVGAGGGRDAPATTRPERSAPSPDPGPAPKASLGPAGRLAASAPAGRSPNRRAAPCGPPYSEMLARLAARLVSLMHAAMPPCPSAAARSAAVYPPAPQRAVARMFAPDARSVATVSSCPLAAAQCSAVRRRRSGWFTSHPLLHSAGMAQFMPSAATQWMIPTPPASTRWYAERAGRLMNPGAGMRCCVSRAEPPSRGGRGLGARRYFLSRGGSWPPRRWRAAAARPARRERRARRPRPRGSPATTPGRRAGQAARGSS